MTSSASGSNDPPELLKILDDFLAGNSTESATSSTDYSKVPLSRDHKLHRRHHKQRLRHTADDEEPLSPSAEAPPPMPSEQTIPPQQSTKTPPNLVLPLASEPCTSPTPITTASKSLSGNLPRIGQNCNSLDEYFKDITPRMITLSDGEDSDEDAEFDEGPTTMV